MRLVADRLTQIWKQQIVVLNRPGAGGLIAAQAAAGVEKDGYTLYMTQASTFTVLPITQEGKMPVDLQKAFVPIGMVGEQPIGVAVNKDIPVNNVAELIELIKKTPGGMLFGATNRGGQSHLTGELFRDRAKVNLSLRPCGGRGGIAQRRHRRTHSDHVRGPRRPRARHAGRRHQAARHASEKRLPNLPNLPAINETVPGRGVERLDRADGAGRNARPHHPEGQCGPAQGRGRCPTWCERFQVLGTYTRDLTPGADRRVHAQRRAAVVAGRAPGREVASARRVIRLPRRAHPRMAQWIRADLSHYGFIVARSFIQAAIPAWADFSSTPSGSPATPTPPTS